VVASVSAACCDLVTSWKRQRLNCWRQYKINSVICSLTTPSTSSSHRFVVCYLLLLLLDTQAFCEAQLAWKYLFAPIWVIFRILTSEVSQTDFLYRYCKSGPCFLVCDESSFYVWRIISLCVQRLWFLPPCMVDNYLLQLLHFTLWVRRRRSCKGWVHRGIGPPHRNPGGIIPLLFRLNCRAKLFSNVQLFFFSFLKWKNNWQIYCMQHSVYSLFIVYAV